MKTPIFSVLLVFACLLSAKGANGQSCRPAVLNYIVRDAKGKNLSEPELRSVRQQLQPPAPEVATLSLAANGTLVGYSTKETKTKLAVLQYANAAACQLKIGELTLKHAGKTMRLIFDLDIYRRAYAIDAPRFQDGTFKLDQSGLSESYYDRIVPAAKWKMVSRKP